MKVGRIVTGYNAAGQLVVKTDEQLTAVPASARASRVARFCRLMRCRSRTPRPRTRTRLNGLDWSSTTIL
jgi:hypothetical protein